MEKSKKRRESLRAMHEGPPDNYSSPIHPSLNHNHHSGASRHYHMSTPVHQLSGYRATPVAHPIVWTPSSSGYHPNSQRGGFSTPGPVAHPSFWTPSSSGSSNGYHSNSQWGGFSTPGPVAHPSVWTPTSSGSFSGHHPDSQWGRLGGSPMSGNSVRGPQSFSGRGRGRGNNKHSLGLSGGRDGGRPLSVKTNKPKAVVDPWRDLKPVVGNILIPLAGPGFWLPLSVKPKKPKIDEKGIGLSLELNFAECLSQSIEEAVNEVNA